MPQNALASNANLDRHMARSDRQILCSYTNTTPHIQVIQLRTSPPSPWQRVVFPGERLMFEALAEAQLEIYVNENAMSLIPCQNLRVTVPSASPLSSRLSLAS